MIRTQSALLSLVLGAAALVGACGGPATTTDGAKPPPDATATATATGDATAPPPPPDATGSGRGVEPPPPPTAMLSRPIGKSKMLADLEKLGIDMKKPTTLEKIPLGKKKKMMPLFQQALGFKECTGCHAQPEKESIDYKKETRNIQIARKMWNEFVAPLRFDDGSGGTGEAVFCDSCHNGADHMFDRSDKKAVSAFMEANYEKPLVRTDGEEHSCGTCHTTEFEPKIFEKLWKIK